MKLDITRCSAKVSMLLALSVLVVGQGDSLRSALTAVNRRQRDLKYSEYYPEEGLTRYDYSPEEKNKLAFLTFLGNERKAKALRKNGDDFENGRKDYGDYKKIFSPFREREDQERREELARSFLNSLDADRNVDDGEDYPDFAQELWEKYENDRSELGNSDVYSDYSKRNYYYPAGFGMRKRSYYIPQEPQVSYYYPSHKNNNNIDEYLAERERRSDDYQKFYPYTFHKRFPVSKRSSPVPDIFTHQHKRSPNPSKSTELKTDPKVEKELSSIFGKAPDKREAKKVEVGDEKKIKTKSKNKTEKANTKEVAQTISNMKPLQVKKKSIKWSDYFGLDRRKKSDNLDNEWLMERYHKAVALTTKRSAEYPLQHFHRHDSDTKERVPDFYEKKANSDSPKNDDDRIREIDEKLKNIEDSIVEDALKYTGAHDGEADPKEVQEVKDRVISQLAAAYSLEKMRRALGEYKQSIAKERDRLKQSGQDDEYLFSEEKRVSVPRKQAIDEEAQKSQEEDNNIKCAQGNCDEQNFKIPSEIFEQYHWGIEQCPKVQRECNDLASAIGKYGATLELACNMHQLCLLCDDNSWFPPTLQCNRLFLSKANELCDGNLECENAARNSISSLLIINRSLHGDPLDNCNLVCPENKR